MQNSDLYKDLQAAAEKLQNVSIPDHGQMLIGGEVFSYDNRFDLIGDIWDRKYVKQPRSPQKGPFRSKFDA